MTGARRIQWPRRRAAVLRPVPRVRPSSPLNEPVWRLALTAFGGCVAAFVLARTIGPGGPVGAWLAAAAATVAWLAAVRLLLLDTRGRRFWTVWLAGGALLLPLLGGRGHGWESAVALAAVFLVVRRYRPYRHLTSRRRAQLFFLGLLALICCVGGWQFHRTEELGSGHVLGQSVLRYALGSLDIFWALTLVHLVAGMRLHFMRLRPKLVTSAVFVAVVPLLLVLLLWVVILFSVLGATRVAAGRALLRDWAVLSVSDPAAGRTLFGTSFSARENGPVDGTAPAWLPRLWPALHAPPPAPPDSAAIAAATAAGLAATDSAADDSSANEAESGINIDLGRDEDRSGLQVNRRWTPVDSLLFLRADAQVWAVQLQRVGEPPLWSIAGFRVDEVALGRLAALLRADVGIYSDRGLTIGGGSGAGRAARRDATRRPLNLLASMPRPGGQPDSTANFWRRPLNFGGAAFGMIRLTADSFVHDAAMFHIKAAPADLGREFLSRENEFNVVILGALATLAILLLLIEAFAVFMGVRIAAGITSAVKVLHQGTVRLAHGDLDTRLEVPNEDEFGDLADSFNEMTEAVRRGREEAVARERLERELRTAREIQERLLPHAMPELPGWEITGVSVPSLQVGGDYFDFLDLPDGRLGVAIADVSGKGIPASLLMANLQALLQGQVIHPGDVSNIVARMNDLLTRATDVGRFATFFYGALDRTTGVFTSTNAGHNPPLLRRADGRFEELKLGGLLIGMLEGQTYRQQTVTIEPGDVLVLFTDGITEAVGPAPVPGSTPGPGQPARGRADGGDATWDGREQSAANGAANGAAAEDDDDDEPVNLFGDEQLREVVEATAGRGAPAVRDAILAAVARHAAGVPPSDDITLIVIRRLP